MSAELIYMEVDGVAWCIEHSGVVDECSDHLDDDGEPCCDMAEPGDKCDIRTLFVRGAGDGEA